LGEISAIDISFEPTQRESKASIVACAGVVGYGVSDGVMTGVMLGGIVGAKKTVGVICFCSVGEDLIDSALPHETMSVPRIITARVFAKTLFMVFAPNYPFNASTTRAGDIGNSVILTPIAR